MHKRVDSHNAKGKVVMNPNGIYHSAMSQSKLNNTRVPAALRMHKRHLKSNVDYKPLKDIGLKGKEINFLPKKPEQLNQDIQADMTNEIETAGRSLDGEFTPTNADILKPKKMKSETFQEVYEKQTAKTIEVDRASTTSPKSPVAVTTMRLDTAGANLESMMDKTIPNRSPTQIRAKSRASAIRQAGYLRLKQAVDSQIQEEVHGHVTPPRELESVVLDNKLFDEDNINLEDKKSNGDKTNVTEANPNQMALSL